MEFWLKCQKCGKEYDPASLVWKCACGSPLDLVKRLEDIRFEPPRTIKGAHGSMWRYQPLLPLLDDECVVTLGEGLTPMVVRRYGNVVLLLKLDYCNPTGSFKDRGASVMISNLKALRVKEVVIDSSGNAGAAVAAYSAAAGIRCRVYVPASAPKVKKAQIRLYGADLVEVAGPRSMVKERLMKELGSAVYASHAWNPYFIEGLKTLAYECVDQAFKPDVAVLPVGSGGLLLGVYGGFLELKELGIIEDLPRIIAVQAAGYTPVYDAIHGPYGKPHPERPLADGIAIPDPPRLHQVVDAVEKTGGDVIVVEDEEVIMAAKLLARMGLLVEPTSATSLAAITKASAEGLIDKGESVFAPLTGSGLKTLTKITAYF